MNYKSSIDKQIIIFIILNVLDVILTYFILVESSYINELNPVYNFLFGLFGLITGLVIFKLSGFIILSYIMYVLTINGDVYASIKIKTIKIINIFYILLILNNLYWAITKIYML